MMSSQFQVRLYQAKNIQVNIPVGKKNSIFGPGPSTAGALLKAVSQLVGIPAENLKLFYDHGDGYTGPSLLITDMNTFLSDRYLYWVDVDKDIFVKKKTKEADSNLFIDDMTKLMDDSETSDFTLKCGSKSFKVHKAILGARSKVFRAMFLSGIGGR